MSIERVNNIPIPKVAEAEAGQKRSSLPAQGAFAQALQAAAGQPQHDPQQLQQVQALFHLTRLQMVQGLFSLDDQAETGQLFNGLDHLGPLVKTTPAEGQMLDNLYHKLQPTLLEAAPTGRGEIDRLIDQVAKKVSLAPELIRSVIEVESAFDPQAVSPVGAQGLMQLMPATAEELGVSDSFDPQQNLLGGSQYLKQLLDKYAGDLDKALAAYNWGQGNVDRKGLGQMPEETRNYLVRVKERLAKTAG